MSIEAASEGVAISGDKVGPIDISFWHHTFTNMSPWMFYNRIKMRLMMGSRVN